MISSAIVGCATKFQGQHANADRFSLWVIGDSGWPSGYLSRSWQKDVARVLERADKARPANSLLLLGDNFYPDGLISQRWEKQVEENLLIPYDHFIFSRQEAEEGTSSERHSIRPVYAVLGNHDYNDPSSPQLQRFAVSELIANWNVPRRDIQTLEFAAGVSLILLNSPVLMNQNEERFKQDLCQAILETNGPWRILAAHHPILVDSSASILERRFSLSVKDAIQCAKNPVQLFLAGHEHFLALSQSDDRSVPVQVISGAGSKVRSRKKSLQVDRLVLNKPGFVRVAVNAVEPSSLRIDFFVVERSFGFAVPRGSIRATYFVQPDGSIQ